MEEQRQRNINASTANSDEQLLSSILRSSNPYPSADPRPDSKEQKSQDQAPPPAPFTPLSSTSPLLPFLETLTDRSKIYVIHVDTTPPAVKRRVFAIPLVLNTVIVGLLLWRMWIMIPFYATILRILPAETKTFDTNDSADVFQSDIGTPNLDEGGPIGIPGKFHPMTLFLILRRTLTFFIDYILFLHIATWPYSFFAERAGNPIHWRFWALRGQFRDMEVVVRRSRGWGVEELRQTGSLSSPLSTTTTTISKSSGIVQGFKSPYFHTRISPVVQRSYLRDMTGYMMMGQYWDLDFGAMARAVEMLDEVRKENENVNEQNEENKADGAEKKRLTLESCRTIVVLWDEIVRFAGTGKGRGDFDATGKGKSRANAAGKKDEKNDDSSAGQWLAWRVF